MAKTENEYTEVVSCKISEGQKDVLVATFHKVAGDNPGLAKGRDGAGTMASDAMRALIDPTYVPSKLGKVLLDAYVARATDDED